MLEENEEIMRLKGEKQKLEDCNRVLLAENEAFKARITELEKEVNTLTHRNEDLSTRLQDYTTKKLKLQVESSDS